MHRRQEFFMRQVLLAVVLMGAALSAGVQGQTKPAQPATAPASRPDDAHADQPSVFDLPRLQRDYALINASVAALFKQGKYDQAEQRIRFALRLVPHDVASHYNLACALARQGKADDALAALSRAVELGYNDRNHMAGDGDLASLHERPEFKALVDKSVTAKPDLDARWHFTCKPGPVADGQALVTESDTAWDARVGLFRVLFSFPPKSDAPIAAGYGQAGDLLRTWQKEGTAAGNHGDLYDNHDSDHANMHFKTFPQLTRVEYSEQAKKRHLHHGLQATFLFAHPTIGNSSTALTSGPFWRSQPRHALTTPRGPFVLLAQYLSNHLYVYPEHRDHDGGRDGAEGKGHGDVLPANTPFMIISQGSSGSDVAFLDAAAATLAAFRPEVKQKLIQSHLLMPTVQMIFRMSNKMVQSEGDYLTGKAHPTAFDSKQLDPAKMVRMAHDLQADALPPVVQIRVTEEDQPVSGVDYFDVPGRGERLFDTPFAVARVARSLRYTRRMVVSAEGSKDPQNKPLKYHWAVLRGDAARIKINPLKPDGSSVELLISHHERRPVLEGSELESNRVDIGAFVHNGQHYSAPAFISLTYLDNQERTYDKSGRLLSVDYAAAARHYVDPALELPKKWRDEYHYDSSGKLTGWTRVRGQDRQVFTPEGKLLVKAGEAGQASQTREVRYAPQGKPGQAPTLEQQ